MNKIQIQLIRELQHGIKLERRPFMRLARDLGLTEEQVIEQMKTWQTEGVIRRIGISVRPERMGYTTNALIAWAVPEERLEEVGTGLSRVKEISHCYERECPPGWPYNIYTMVHAKSPEHLQELIEQQKQQLGLEKFKVFATVKELKKTSMRYFSEATPL